jgi:hypothetical protein
LTILYYLVYNYTIVCVDISQIRRGDILLLKKSYRTKLIIFTILLFFITTTFAGCSSENIRDFPVFGRALDHYINTPNKGNTLVGKAEIARVVEKAISQGEKEISLFATGIKEEDVAGIDKNMSGYWGLPKKYTIFDEYENVKNVKGTVYKLRYTLSQSNNYYVYSYKVKGKNIPKSEKEAKKIVSVIDDVIKEVGLSKNKTDYENALLLHDWIVDNFDYDENINSGSTDNGSYGGLVKRKTMCQGYADSIKLLLDCATNVKSEVIVGKGNAGKEYEAHAWNQIKMDGSWYQVDATFDDPTKNDEGLFYHYYFGQTDAVMSLDHEWDESYFNKCNTQDFLYYRYQGLLADDLSSFKEMVTSKINQNEERIDIAYEGFDVVQNTFNFVFNVDRTIKSTVWNTTGKGDVKVVAIEFKR